MHCKHTLRWQSSSDQFQVLRVSLSSPSQAARLRSEARAAAADREEAFQRGGAAAATFPFLPATPAEVRLASITGASVSSVSSALGFWERTAYARKRYEMLSRGVFGSEVHP